MNRTLKKLGLIVGSLWVAVFYQSVSAEVKIVQNRVFPSVGHISIEGEIREGDAKEFKRIINGPLKVSRVELNSNGGSVVDALEIGNAVAALGLATSVDEESICASACFFVWMAGTPRWFSLHRNGSRKSNGGRNMNIGLHRPFLSSPDGSTSSLAKQVRVQQEIRNHLDAHFIPRRLADVMMSRPSNDIYWLGLEDSDEIGEYPPAIEELLISHCGYDRRLSATHFDLRRYDNAMQNSISKEKKAKVDECTGSLLADRRRRLKAEFR